MASRTSDQVHTSSERQHVTTEDFPKYCTGATPNQYHMDGATPTSVCDTTGQGSESQHDVPGNCNLLGSQQLMSETSEALKKLNEAPAIDSLSSPSGSLPSRVQVQIESVGLLSAGSVSLSQAQAMFHQSLDSGSLTAAVGELKQGQNQFDKQSNMSSASRVTSTEINNILESSTGTVTSNTSSEDNTKHRVLQGNRSHFCCASPPASSYLEMTARTNIEQRMVDFDSISSHTHKKDGIPMNWPSNDLDRGLENSPYPCAGALPNNIPSLKHSMSINEDWSLTSPKSITRSTQTDPPKDQDQDSCGGAASAESAVQTMSSGPASSFPSDDVLVRKLKRPIIQWLQRKLETNIGMAWQDLVDLHDWDYERITDFESFCTGKSPFCMLLAEPEFQMYRISDLKQDLEKLPRRDILYDLDEVLRRHYK